MPIQPPSHGAGRVANGLKPTVVAVVGPTAVGKSSLAEELALLMGGEIVSADSMQVYRGMDIGTAKPPVPERRVALHCIDMVEPGEPFSAALYQRAARRAIDDMFARRLVPIVCGGTGLYVRAAVDVMEFPAGEQVGNATRQRYEAYAGEHGGQALYQLLLQADPAAARAIHPNNTRRVIRALEMSEQGLSYADGAATFGARTAFYRTRFLGLTMKRELLYDRIDKRVDDMMRRGLVDEVETLVRRGLRDALTASQAIGYKELVAVIEGRADLAQAVDSIKRASRRYAKRQLTWFRADSRVVWVDVTEMSQSQTVHAALDALEWTAQAD